MKYCQGPKCHEYRTKDRIRGPKGAKHYQTRRRTDFYYMNGNCCSFQCQSDWFDKFGTLVLDHFGRTVEPKKTDCDNAWYKTYDLPVIITNCSNNFGPYQFPEKLIPLIVGNALEGRSLPVYGSGQNIRDWLYVEDHARALLMVTQKGRMGESYNIGGGSERKNLDLVKEICNILDRLCPTSDVQSYSELISFVEDRPGHDFRYSVDDSKIRKELGWKPRWDFETGLEKTVLWYLDNRSWMEKVKAKSYSHARRGLASS